MSFVPPAIPPFDPKNPPKGPLTVRPEANWGAYILCSEPSPVFHFEVDEAFYSRLSPLEQLAVRVFLTYLYRYSERLASAHRPGTVIAPSNPSDTLDVSSLLDFDSRVTPTSEPPPTPPANPTPR